MSEAPIAVYSPRTDEIVIITEAETFRIPARHGHDLIGSIADALRARDLGTAMSDEARR